MTRSLSFSKVCYSVISNEANIILSAKNCIWLKKSCIGQMMRRLIVDICKIVVLIKNARSCTRTSRYFLGEIQNSDKSSFLAS